MSEDISHFIESNLRSHEKGVQTLSQLKTLINNEIDTKEKIISSQRIKLKTSRGIWRSDKKMVEIIVNKNINPLIGSTINSVKYLNPLEALYLMENHSLEVLYEDIPLSIEQSFELFLKDQNQINLYRVYTTLCRSGYSVKRHESFDKNVKKRKLSETEIQFNTNYYELSSFITNYKSIVNIRQLSLNPTLNRLFPLNFNHSEDKQIEIKDSEKSLMYEIEDKDIPLELNPMLTLFRGNVKPLCDLGSVLSSNQLFDLMQTSGPKEKSSVVRNRTKTDSILDVFSLSAKKVDKNSKFNVIVTKTENEVPKADEIFALEDECNSKRICFAVFDSNDFVFYSVSRFEVNPEYPFLWQKYLKSEIQK